jgi:hypothetical protein
VDKPSPPKAKDNSKNPEDWDRKTPSVTFAHTKSPGNIMSSTSKNQNGWGEKSALEATAKVKPANHFDSDAMWQTQRYYNRHMTDNPCWCYEMSKEPHLMNPMRDHWLRILFQALTFQLHG